MKFSYFEMYFEGAIQLEVFTAWHWFEEMSAKICLRAREPDAVIKRATSGSRASGSRPLGY